VDGPLSHSSRHITTEHRTDSRTVACGVSAVFESHNGVWRVGGLSHHITAYNIRASDRFPLVWMVLDHTIASHHNRASNRFTIVASHSGVWRVGGTVMCVGDRRIHSGIASRNTTYTTTSERQNGSRSSITPHHSIAHPSIGRIRARVDVLYHIAPVAV
jgi:hypothetical protein